MLANISAGLSPTGSPPVPPPAATASSYAPGIQFHVRMNIKYLQLDAAKLPLNAAAQLFRAPRFGFFLPHSSRVLLADLVKGERHDRPYPEDDREPST
jgi:hypothetical protein